MQSELHTLFTLAHCLSVKPREKGRFFVEAFPEYAEMLGFDWVDRVRISSGKRQLISEQLEAFNLGAHLNRLEKMNIEVVTILEDRYPPMLRHIYAPPLLLYYKGDWELTKGQLLGVVGSRRHSNYGKEAVQSIIPKIASHNIGIVSGLARGIDTLAHKITVKQGGTTIAVIGTGIHHYYPTENRSLQKYIAQDHLLISEYPPQTKADKHHFPDRNRIISGLSRGVLVVEAKQRSGSLITANRALEEGRDVFAIPGAIDNAYSTGTNNLIKLGAIPVTQADDILSQWELY